MGNSVPAKHKNLVIVGGSSAGLFLADKLKDEFNITLIEKKDHFEWICSMPHSLFDLKYFEDEATVMLHDMIEKDQVFGPNVHYVQAMLTQLVDDSTIKIKRTEHAEDNKTMDDIPEEVINYDYIVICTGTHYKMNENDVNNVVGLYSRDQRKDFLERYADEIDKAKSVLVVGAGATGTECLGEIIEKYGDKKKYGLANSPNELLVGFPDVLKQVAHDHFKANNVKFHLGKRFDPEGELAKEYDYVLMAIGLHCHTPFMDNETFREFKGPRGHVYVNEHFQMCNQDPNKPADREQAANYKVYPNIFAYGDSCVTRMMEPKNIPSIKDTALL